MKKTIHIELVIEKIPSIELDNVWDIIGFAYIKMNEFNIDVKSAIVSKKGEKESLFVRYPDKIWKFPGEDLFAQFEILIIEEYLKMKDERVKEKH